jgi:hypothetical protein
MKDYASSVNDPVERITKRTPQLALNRFGNAVDGKLRSTFVDNTFADFLAQAVDNGADRVSSSGAALAFE